MMRQVFGGLFLTSTLVMVACGQGQVQMEDFSSEVGQFSISTPAPLEETQQSVDTPVGPINIYTFTAEQGDAAYVVAYSDYPQAMVEQTNPDELLDSSRDGAIANLGGTLISEEAIDIEGNPGRSIVIGTDVNDNQPATINSRIYLVENRLYQILVVSPDDNDIEETSSTFLESFSLL